VVETWLLRLGAATTTLPVVLTKENYLVIGTTLVSFSGKGKNMRFRTFAAIMLSSFWFPGSVNEPASAQQWTVELDDVYIEDPDGIADRTHAESVEFMPDGKTLITAGCFYNAATKDSVGEVRLRNAADGSLTATLRGKAVTYALRAGSLAVSSSGNLIAAAGRSNNNDSIVDIFDPTTRKLVHTLKGDPTGISCVSFSPDCRVLAVAHIKGTVELWDPESGKLISSFAVRNSGVWPVTFSPDGTLLATGNQDGTISFWDPTTAERIGHIPTQDIRMPASVVFSADGNLVAGGGFPSRDGKSPIHVWEMNVRNDGRKSVTVKTKARFEGHRKHTYALAFSPDGNLLASANQDMTVKIWDVSLNKEVATITSHNDFVYDVAFSFNGEALATLGRDSLKLWKTEQIKRTE
jgi:WD40 repeat protein